MRVALFAHRDSLLTAREYNFIDALHGAFMSPATAQSLPRLLTGAAAAAQHPHPGGPGLGHTSVAASGCALLLAAYPLLVYSGRLSAGLEPGTLNIIKTV